MVKYVHSKPTISDEEINVAIEVLKSGQLQDGEYVRTLEESFKSYYEKDFAVAVSNGFSALHLSLIALGVTFGDEVIIPSYSCPALYNPIVLLGATPILADVEYDALNIGVSTIENLITSKTKAIIVPHMYGFPCEIEEIKSLGIKVIEDCAQSIGASIKGERLGTFGDIAIFSFYASKMVTGGDGGMIITNDEEVYQLINDYKYYGHKKGHNVIAYNYHLTNLNAAIANQQFKKLDQFVEIRQLLAKEYDNKLKQFIDVFEFKNRSDSSFFRYPIILKNYRDEIIQDLKNEGVNCGYGVLDGLHELHPNGFAYPSTDYLLKSVLCLPIYPSMTSLDINNIVSIFIKIFKKYS